MATLSTFSSLFLCCLDPDLQKRHGRYRYTVTEATLAHTAFHTRAGLLRWLSERGLQLTRSLPADDTYACMEIKGSYRTMVHWSGADWGASAKRRFDALDPVLTTRALSNGEYVVAKITRDADGIRVVHTLNPNVRGRETFGYAESQAMIDGEWTVAP